CKLILPQRLPGPREQVVAPAGLEGLVGIAGGRLRGWLRMIGRQQDGFPAFTVVILGDEVEEHTLDKVAEAAALWIGSAEVALQEIAGELLEEFLGGRGIAEESPEVATDGSAVALEDLPLGVAGQFARRLIGAAHQRPEGGDAAEMLVQAFRLHGG